MSIIGRFNYDVETDTYAGDVLTLTFQRGNMRLVPNKKSRDEEPDYRLVGSTPLGDVEFGAAWKRNDKNSQGYLSVSIDDPALMAIVNAAMFLAEDGESATLVWKRKKPDEKAASAPKAKSEPKPKAKAKAA